jgi:tetratricopeptide (TPR) repeat protein
LLKKIKPYLIINKINTFVIFFLFSFSALSAGGGDDDKKDTSVKSAYYYKAVKLIKKKSFNLAIENLLKAEQNNKTDPDIYNYLGFSFRKTGDLEKAGMYYNKALTISPKHKGALEYQGEMFLTLGQLQKAESNLKKLEKICFLGCEEEKMLKSSISKYKQGQKSNY